MVVDLMGRRVPDQGLGGRWSAVTSLRVAFLLEQAWHRVPGGTAVAAVQSARALVERDDVDLLGVTARHRSTDLPPLLFGSHGPDHLPIVSSALPRFVLYEAWRHHPEAATRRGRRLFEGWLRDARRADRIVCPSEATRGDLVEAGFDGARIRIVPLGVGRTDVEPRLPALLRARHGLEGPFVLWVGTLEPRKNLDRLVAAMSAAAPLSDVPLVLVGPTGWRTDVARTVAPLGERAVVVGSVSEVEKRAWYEAADVFCLPSLHEGFGLPVLEAMAHGVPVVTSAGTATEELAGDAGLTVDPTDTGAIAEALCAVLDDETLAARLAHAGRTGAASRRWSDTADGLMAVYREVAG